MSTIRKICVITGTRAEYGLLKRLLYLLQTDNEFEIQLVVTGSHLDSRFGDTYKEIEEDGFCIKHKVDMNLTTDTALALTQSTATGLSNFGKIFNEYKPDLLLVLGDRYEILAAVIAAMFTCLPIAHIHGGEVTEGVIDEAIRHAITKFSHLHFVSTNAYKKRVEQLGEQPGTVFNVGGLGVDAINNIKLFNKEELEHILKIKFNKKNILVTFHPATLEENTSKTQMQNILNALSKLKEICIIFTMPSLDKDSQIISDLIEKFVEIFPHAYCFRSLGQKKYLSCVKQVDCILGNSSSGLLEAPLFKKATINIGKRQQGRIKASSVIDCDPLSFDIQAAISKAFSKNFQESLDQVESPYGNGGASEHIIEILKSWDSKSSIVKKFYDIEQI